LHKKSAKGNTVCKREKIKGLTFYGK